MSFKGCHLRDDHLDRLIDITQQSGIPSSERKLGSKSLHILETLRYLRIHLAFFSC